MVKEIWPVCLCVFVRVWVNIQRELGFVGVEIWAERIRERSLKVLALH